MAVVKVTLDTGQYMTASITRDAVEELGLEPGTKGHRARKVHGGHARR